MRSFYVEFWGDGACFTRPESKVDRFSYDMLTPSAARNMLQAIYWHPGMDWVIDSIQVCKPIQFQFMKRNERNKCITLNEKDFFGLVPYKPIKMYGSRTPRNMAYLRNVKYIVKAHFVVYQGAPHNYAAYEAIIQRRLTRGAQFKQPYFGTREFPAYWKMVDGFEPCIPELQGIKDLSFMVLDGDFSNPDDIVYHFFRCILKDSILDVPPISWGGNVICG